MTTSSARSTFTLRSLLLALTLAACTSKRPQVFTQGQGSNLDTIASWSTRFVDVTTGQVIGTPPTTNAQEKVTIAPEVRNMNHFELVELRIADDKTRELVGSAPFRGRENAGVGVYQLEIRLTDNYLKILKVGRPEDLPFEEHFYKEETLPDGRIAIPYLGYKVKSFYRVEAEKTSDDQEGHHLIEVEEEDPARATHVRIDWGSRELFEPIRKVDLFPAEFFFAWDESAKKFKPHEWYYAETVTEKSLNDSSTIIGESAMRVENSKLNPATKVVFLPREGELRVVNVARDERLSRDQIQNGADLNAEATMLLPIQWRDYRTKAEGTSLSLKGEVVEERKWNERKYFEIDFLNLESAAIVNGGRGGRATAVGLNRLIDMQIDNNYFSFTILNMVGSTGRKIHYSFLRADRDRLPYAPKRSFKEDRNTFGFFSTTKPFYPNWEYYTEGDFNRREYLSRMNPARGSIVFHLSKDSPKELEKVTADAVAAWDRAFSQALEGTGRRIRVEFSPERTQLGDLRYNTIHLVDTLSEDGLLGFGPSIADPETGEIVSATTNVYVNSFQSISASTVRQYIINRLEGRLSFDRKEEPKKSTPVVADPLQIGGGFITFLKSRAHVALERFQELSSQDLKTADPKHNSLLAFDAKTEKQLREQALGDRCQYATGIAATSSDEEIRKTCPEIEKIVAAHLGRDFVSRASTDHWTAVWDAVNRPEVEGDPRSNAITKCSRRITQEKLLSTLIHEIGHNLGLRHNFSGSVDKANFRQIKTAQGETITPQSSSIMEYTVWEEDRLTEAGKYDIAAIRFGYGDHVDLKDGTSVALPADRTIADSIRAKGRTKADLKPYLFCTDEEAAYSFNALCRMHDYGTTPSEIVDYYTGLYERLQEIRKHRRVRPFAGSTEGFANDNVGRIFIPLKEIYDQWRYHLGEYVRKSNRYLADLTPETYAALLARMKTDPVYGPIYRDYHDAADRIYKFFKGIAFGSNQYCLIQEAGGKRAIEFDRLRDLLSESTRGSLMIRNCAEAASAAELAQVLGETAPPKVLGETGHPLNSYRFDAASTVMESVTDDVIGNSATRMIAGAILAFRYPNVRNLINKFQPSMIDEPNHFVEVAQALVNRAVGGVELDSKLGFEGPEPLFEQEATLYTRIFQAFKTGLYVPNANGDAIDQNATRTKLGPFSVYTPQPNEDLSSAAAVLTMNDRPVYAAISQNYFLAYNLINAYNQTSQLLALKSISEKTAAQVEPFFRKVLPAAAGLGALKVKDLVEIYKSVQGFKQNLGGLHACLQKGSEPLAQLDKVFALLVADYGKLTSEEQAAAFLDRNLAEYVKAGLKQDFKATQESLTSLAPAVKACVDQQNSVVRVMDKYRKDYNAQKSLLLNVLTTFAQ